MPSQDDDSEEVSVNSLHDVMALMTRRLEQLLVRQDERQARMFAEQFEVPFDKIGRSVDTHSVIVDFTEQTLSLCVETSMRKCEVDGIYERLEREVPTYSEGGHSEASESGTQQRREPGETLAEEGDEEESLARCGDVEVSVATQDICGREQSANVPSDNDLYVSVLPTRTVKWYTIPGQHTPNVRSVNSGPSDGPGVDSTRLVEEKVDRFCARVGVG